MKHLKSINEIFGIGNAIRKKFNSDEDIAIDILNKMNNDTKIEKEQEDYRKVTYKFNINNFSVEVSRHDNSIDPDSYSLLIDGTKISCSNNISKKIMRKSEEILDHPKKEEENYIKKDYRISNLKK